MTGYPYDLEKARRLLEERRRLGRLVGRSRRTDVEIGEKAKILPNSVVLPKTRIPAGETWGGVPAIRIPKEQMDQIKAHIRGLVDMP